MAPAAQAQVSAPVPPFGTVHGTIADGGALAQTQAAEAAAQAMASAAVPSIMLGRPNGPAQLGAAGVLPPAQLPIGTGSGTVAAGDDARIPSAPAGAAGGAAVLDGTGHIPAAQATLSASSLGAAPVTVSAADTSPGITIPADFAGLSFDTCDALVPCSGWLPAGSSYFDPANTPLINAVKLISPSMKIRIGGNSSDYVPAPPITAQIASNLAAFLTATNATLIYGLDAKLDSASTAATQAGLIAGAVGVGNVSFQIGNEPSLTTAFPAGQTNFQPALTDYYQLWLSYHSAVTAAVPAAKFMGPDDVTANHMAAFASAVGAANITDETFHLYPLQSGTSLFPTIEHMLSSPTGYGFAGIQPPASFVSSSVAPAVAAGAGARLTEFNSAFSGGTPGVSNTLASAAWVLDYAMQYATAGWRSVHLHNRLTPSSSIPVFYSSLQQAGVGTPISAAPIFYGMMLLGRLAGGQVLPVTVANGFPQGQVAVVGYGVKSTSTDGKTRIVAINRSTDRAALITFARTSAWTSGAALLLTGAGCADTATVTLGGAAVQGDGTWPGATTAITPTTAVTLPPCGAVLGVLG